MQKIINDRPLFYCFLAFGFGLIIARPIFSLDILSCVLIFVSLLAISFFCVKYKKFVSLALIVLFLTFGIGSYFLSVNSFNAKSYGSDKCNIWGRVSVCSVIDENQSVILDSVYINGEKVDKCVNVYIFDCTEMEEGVILSFDSVIKNNSLFTLGKFNSYNYKYNVAYSCSASYEDVEVVSLNNLSWTENLKQNIKYSLFKHMDNDSASVCYASLFGDKTYIEESIKTSFSISGTAHLLAVSGLHIGFLVALLSFVLKILKIKKYYKLAIIIAILGFYCYLCNFSISVLRASIMFLVMDIANVFGKKYDRLNAWGLAGIICLLFKPLSVLDGGFLLSFFCVLCIFMFTNPINQKLKELKFPKFLSSSLSVLIPVQFGLLPLISLYYNNVSLLSIVANFFCVPLFEIFFMLLFACLPIVLILPFLSFILIIPQAIIGVIMFITQKLTLLNFAVIELTALTGAVVIFCYIVMFISSHYINLKAKTKIITAWAFVLLASLCAVLTTYPIKPSNNKITIINDTSLICYLEISDESFAVGDFSKRGLDLVEDYTRVARTYRVDNYVSFNNVKPSNERLIFKNVYNNDDFEESEIKTKNNVTLTKLKFGKFYIGLMISFKGDNIVVTTGNIANDLNYAEMGLVYQDIDLIIGNSKSVNKIKEYINVKNIIETENGISYLTNNKTVSGNWTFELKQGNIINMRGVD